MAGPKTKETTASVTEFLYKATPEIRKKDGFELLSMFKSITGQKAIMWGPSIIGFGKWHFKSERSSQEGDWPIVAFSPRKSALTLYVMSGSPNQESLLKKLGKHKASKGCLYINKLSDIDKNVLQEIIKEAFEYMKSRYSTTTS